MSSGEPHKSALEVVKLGFAVGIIREAIGKLKTASIHPTVVVSALYRELGDLLVCGFATFPEWRRDTFWQGLAEMTGRFRGEVIKRRAQMIEALRMPADPPEPAELKSPRENELETQLLMKTQLASGFKERCEMLKLEGERKDGVIHFIRGQLSDVMKCPGLPAEAIRQLMEMEADLRQAVQPGRVVLPSPPRTQPEDRAAA